MQSSFILPGHCNNNNDNNALKVPSYLYNMHSNIDLRNCGIAEHEWWQGECS